MSRWEEHIRSYSFHEILFTKDDYGGVVAWNYRRGFLHVQSKLRLWLYSPEQVCTGHP
jgi:hypothetical protein